MPGPAIAVSKEARHIVRVIAAHLDVTPATVVDQILLEWLGMKPALKALVESNVVQALATDRKVLAVTEAEGTNGSMPSDQ